MDIKSKRIGVLAPVAWRTPPRAYGAWETVASNITEGLVARGWKNVTLFATKESETHPVRSETLRGTLPKGLMLRLTRAAVRTTCRPSRGAPAPSTTTPLTARGVFGLSSAAAPALGISDRIRIRTRLGH